MRRDPRDRASLDNRFAGARDIERLQIADAAVDRPQMVERRSAAEIVLLDQGDRQAALRRVVGDGQPIDPSANDQQVEGAASEGVEIADHV